MKCLILIKIDVPYPQVCPHCEINLNFGPIKSPIRSFGMGVNKPNQVLAKICLGNYELMIKTQSF